ncbi:MAG: hypothetical protein WAW37_05720 [Syntrophobacteraceae bacterium]
MCSFIGARINKPSPTSDVNMEASNITGLCHAEEVWVINRIFWKTKKGAKETWNNAATEATNAVTVHRGDCGGRGGKAMTGLPGLEDGKEDGKAVFVSKSFKPFNPILITLRCQTLSNVISSGARNLVCD